MILERLYSPRYAQALLEGEFFRHGDVSAWPAGLAAATISFDVEHRADVAVLPAFCRQLAKVKISGSFAVIGKYVEQYPEEHRAIAGEGHEMINHSYTHPSHLELCPGLRFDQLRASQVRTEIERCHEAVATRMGVEMAGFRNPHFLRQFHPAVYPALLSLGYSHSSSRAMKSLQAMPLRMGGGLVEFPISPCPAHLYTVFDSYHLRSKRTLRGRHTEVEYFELGKTLADCAVRHRSYINLYFDPSHVIECRPFWDFLRFLTDTDVRVLAYGSLHRLLSGGSRPAH